MARPERGEKTGALLWILQAVVALAALLTFRSRPRRPPGVDPEDLAEGYEHSDIRPGVVLGGAAALLVVVAVVVVAVTAFEATVTGVPPRITPPDERPWANDSDAPFGDQTGKSLFPATRRGVPPCHGAGRLRLGDGADAVHVRPYI